MIGLARNLITLVQAGLAAPRTPQSCIIKRFWVTPFDVGMRVLKSDRYLQLAEAAQLDFMVRTRCAWPQIRAGISFVNASQLIRFVRPVGLFQRIDVATAIVFADDKCAYFSHTLMVQGALQAEVLVKMKFKKGRLTIAPRDVFGECPSDKPAHLAAWDEALHRP